MRPILMTAMGMMLVGTAIAAPNKPRVTRAADSTAALAQAVGTSTRTPANVARDRYRHPVATLQFLGIKPTDTVVELWPGGGWYTEILAPYLAGSGKLIVAPPPGQGADSIGKRLAAQPARYGRVGRTTFPKAIGGTGLPPASADAVLTFRNVHNWRMGYGSSSDTDYSAAVFAEIYAALKPGGTLGIEDHRLNETADRGREKTSGYIKVSTVRQLAQAAGFRFAGSSELYANPRDTKDYPKGVWTLPPNFAEGDVDRARYAAIGESDRMLLKFVKPK